MEDPFNIGFKAFFGVITGIGIIVLTINFIQIIDSEIKYNKEKERKERAIIREKQRKEYLRNFSNDVLKDFR